MLIVLYFNDSEVSFTSKYLGYLFTCIYQRRSFLSFEMRYWCATYPQIETFVTFCDFGTNDDNVGTTNVYDFIDIVLTNCAEVLLVCNLVWGCLKRTRTKPNTMKFNEFSVTCYCASRLYVTHASYELSLWYDIFIFRRSSCKRFYQYSVIIPAANDELSNRKLQLPIDTPRVRLLRLRPCDRYNIIPLLTVILYTAVIVFSVLLVVYHQYCYMVVSVDKKNKRSSRVVAVAHTAFYYIIISSICANFKRYVLLLFSVVKLLT